MGFMAFLRWYLAYILQFSRQISFDARITLATFLGLSIATFILSSLHVDSVIGIGTVIGTLLVVTVTYYRISIQGRRIQQRQR